MPAEVIELTAKINGRKRKFQGREAWTLDKLAKAGESGVTPIERPAPRWSHYVYSLRGQGVEIETIREKHKGPYPGTHARYRLASKVEVLERRSA